MVRDSKFNYNYNVVNIDKKQEWKWSVQKVEGCTLKAVYDLLVFLILTALLTCLPGSSRKNNIKYTVKNKKIVTWS